MADHGCRIERAVRLVTMEVDGNSGDAQYELNLRDYWQIIRKRRRC